MTELRKLCVSDAHERIKFCNLIHEEKNRDLTKIPQQPRRAAIAIPNWLGSAKTLAMVLEIHQLW